MADFPKLEPYRRSLAPGEFNHSPVPGIAGTSARFIHPTVHLRQRLTLTYRLITLAETDLIRTHHADHYSGHVAFRLPGIIWAGRTGQANDAAWVYDGVPKEEELPGQRHNVTVVLLSTLETVARTTTDP